MLVTFICAGVVVFCDYTGIFNRQVVNNNLEIQTYYRWDAYKDFTDLHPIDVVKFGNSHSVLGASPVKLSLLLNANCFDMAFYGETLTSTYYSMQECFRIKKPKIAIVETYCMYLPNNYSSHTLTPDRYAFALNAFYSRSNNWNKISSAPILFTSDYYLSAYSKTIRNHSFILTDFEQIKKNLNGENEYVKYSATHNDYFLGQDINGFPRLTDSMLANFDTSKAVDASEIIISNEAKEYLEKIVNLCKDNDVKLIFLTIPVHYRIYKNWEVFNSKLSKELQKYDIPRLDLQTDYDTAKYIPMVFSHQLNNEQHLTWYGQIIISQQVAEYLKNNFSEYLPKRNPEEQIKLFYNCPDFFGFSEYIYWYPVIDGDKLNRAFLKNTKAGNYIVQEVDYAISNRQNAHKLVMKVIGNQDVTDKKVYALISAVYQNEKINTWIEFAYHPEYFAANHYVFQCDLNLEIQIEDILAVQIN
ncbi:MAG: hypothetical protein LBO69_03705 [Ignavibacteria bacterium]|nr:hypothetical protein [Ignavibacteria bacterium]